LIADVLIFLPTRRAAVAADCRRLIAAATPSLLPIL